MYKMWIVQTEIKRLGDEPVAEAENGGTVKQCEDKFVYAYCGSCVG
jgi:hypothetical protein